jgi:hypothetical protein
VQFLFVEFPGFTQFVGKYLREDEYARLQQALLANPTLGAVIQGTGGIRKVRWTSGQSEKGKRSGVRVIYFYFVVAARIYLLTIYGKGIKADLSADEKKVLKRLIQAEEKALSGP